ncbi:CRISPR-associated helicase Cas3' [uncultured Candidatus Kuenenia sp.]|jgi:CRISPR-associated endonuclease/helicase Cas3|uniref:CRISPR-associated helicase Cas3' n=1 Tax=uncultured Candidatus Kuenenia sp. TaxID=1048336 RepID=UPI0025F6F360|nr:CRISPR-associated helicase Cas3' [uncultured Candidatus Kuenenia sp.]
MLKPKNKNMQKSQVRVIPLKDCLAKTIRLKSGNKPGVSVETHCLIVGHVARALLSRVPVWLRESLFPKGSELIAAAHDVGKVNPKFQEKIHRDIGVVLGITNPEDKTNGYHFSVSQAAASSCPKYIPEILGKHHGDTPPCINSSDAEVYGGSGWQKQRVDLINILKDNLKVDWPMLSSALHSDVLAGLTTVADWIGSGSLFDEVDQESWKNYIHEALDRAGFVAPIIRKGLTFKEVFGVFPYRVQTHLVESVKMQGVYVLEAPMGIGKTEAALYAAYRILEKGDATGIYFALPTQLTSDKIHERMKSFLGGDLQKNLQGILDKSDTHRSSLLLHSSAWLRDTELGEDGSPGHSWFNSSKRGLLAPFAVGTIDQALMAVMNVKYGFVRTFGLAGKVVILDEVHSYDSYTGTILNELVKSLRELHCTVIILSATLTDKQRHSIMGTPFKNLDTKESYSPYPLISAYTKEGVLQELETEKLDESKVSIYISLKDDDAVNEVLKRAERGEQVLWIENTVDEAQKRYRLLAAKAREIGLDCGLLHSRFLKIDRRRNEGKWAGLFGKAGRDSRQEKGRILVGTQVLEQSLDIDADFLVTHLCPTDMLFQRLGRLWRHRENDDIRPKEAKREVWIMAPRLNDAVQNQKSLGKSAKVYSPYILCRTLEVWQGISSVNIPGEIRPLLEATYKERHEKDTMARYKQETETKRETLSRLALYGVSRGGKTLSENKALTRYSETESVEVLLIKKQVQAESGTLLRLLDGSELLLPKFTDAVTRRQKASELLKNTVSVPVHLAPVAKTRQIEWLRGYVYLGDYEESPFRVAIVLDSDELQGIGCSDVSEDYNLNYDSCLGYRAEKKERNDDDE